MKKQKVEPVDLPYASTVASFYGDQGGIQGNSFLGRLFNSTGRARVNQTQGGAGPTSSVAAAPIRTGGGGGGGSRTTKTSTMTSSPRPRANPNY